jgi:hypothetical protein
LIWKAAADNLESAQRRIKLLMGVEPGDYVIYSQKTGHKTLVRSENPAPGPANSEDLQFYTLPLVSIPKCSVDINSMFYRIPLEFSRCVRSVL